MTSSPPSNVGGTPVRRRLPWNIRRDRYGRVVTPCLWLGPRSGPDAAVYVVVQCPHCDAEMVVGPERYEVRRWEWRSRVVRESADSVHLETKRVPIDERAETVCLVCGADLALRMVQRFHEPWHFGCGVVKSLKGWREVKE